MILKGVTNKGKNRIREHGDEWIEVASIENPSNVCLTSVRTGYTKWLKPDFEIVE